MPKEPSPLGPAAVLCYEDLLEAELPGLPSFAWTLAAETDACGLCYTSGTTGDPKGVLYSHRSNFLHALAIALPDSLDLHSDTTFLMVVPMFHAWGLAFAAPMVGARLVLPGPALDGPSVHALMLAHGVTHTAGVPTVWLGLMQHLRGRRAGVPGLRLMIVGGAACPRALVDYFEGQHGVEVRQAWGMTELSPCGTLAAMKGPLAGALDSQGVAALKLSQGRPHVFLDMRVVGEGGNELPHDGASFGDLQVRGPIAVRRYFRGAAPATDADGWFDTGDVGTVDAHGYMRITDRSKDVIKSGGEWISSIEIENLAVGHPGVAEAAVIGLPDDKWGERPLLVVVPQAGGQVRNRRGGGRTCMERRPAAGADVPHAASKASVCRRRCVCVCLTPHLPSPSCSAPPGRSFCPSWRARSRGGGCPTTWRLSSSCRIRPPAKFQSCACASSSRAMPPRAAPAPSCEVVLKTAQYRSHTAMLVQTSSACPGGWSRRSSPAWPCPSSPRRRPARRQTVARWPPSRPPAPPG